MTQPTLLWWAVLSGVALLNMVLWIFSARLFRRRRGRLEASARVTRERILWLAAVYVLGCAFRSFLPMIDAPRICLHDTVLSRIVIGRSVATIAELCFAAQFALLLGELGRETRQRLVQYVGLALVPLIAIAEGFSWTAVLTANYLLHAIENSLWACGAAATIIALARVRSAVDTRAHSFVTALLGFGGAYIAFMAVIDVPMYVSRWHAALEAGSAPLALAEGLQEIVAQCRVVRDWGIWREEVPWLSLYFSTAVWASILLPHAPPLGPARRHTTAAPASIDALHGR